MWFVMCVNLSMCCLLLCPPLSLLKCVTIQCFIGRVWSIVGAEDASQVAVWSCLSVPHPRRHCSNTRSQLDWLCPCKLTYSFSIQQKNSIFSTKLKTVNIFREIEQNENPVVMADPSRGKQAIGWAILRLFKRLFLWYLVKYWKFL